MSLSKKIDLLRDFAAGVLSVWGPLPSYDPKLPLPPPLHTVYLYTLQYNYSHREGGGGEAIQGEG